MVFDARSHQELSVKKAMTHTIDIIGIEGEP